MAKRTIGGRLAQRYRRRHETKKAAASRAKKRRTLLQESLEARQLLAGDSIPLTFVIDFVEPGESNQTDSVGGATVSPINPGAFGLSTGDLPELKAGVLQKVKNVFLGIPHSGEVADSPLPPGALLDLDIVLGDAGTVPSNGAEDYYYVQLGSLVSKNCTSQFYCHSPVDIAGGAASTDVGSISASIFSSAVSSLGNLSPADALTGGDLDNVSTALSQAVSAAIGGSLSLRTTNPSTAVTPRGGVPVMSVHSSSFVNQDILAPGELAISAELENVAGTVNQPEIQQLIDLLGLRIASSDVLDRSPRLISVAPNAGELLRSGLTTLNISPTELTFRFDGGQQIDPATLDAIQLTRAGGDGSFDDGNEVVITPGFIGLGDTGRIVVMRFAEPLPDDQYQLDVLAFDSQDGSVVGLRNVEGFLLAPSDPNADRERILFDIELGAQVVAVNPQPVDRDPTTGAFTQRRNQVDIFFNDDDLAAGPVTTTGDSSDLTVVTPDFYQLILTGDTVRNTDDVVFRPTSISYDPATDRAVLTFEDDLATLAGGAGTFRLRVGNRAALPLPPIETSVSADPGSTWSQAVRLGDNGLADISFDSGEMVIITRAGDQLTDGATLDIETTGGTTQFQFDDIDAPGGPATGVVGVPFSSSAPTSTAGIAQSLVNAINGAGITGLAAAISPTDPDQVLISGDTALRLSNAVTGVRLGSQGIVLSEAITNDGQRYPLHFPGGNDDPGSRTARPQEPLLARADFEDGIATIYYNFAKPYGTDPQNNPLSNAITTAQKERVREIFSLVESELGVRFIETADRGFQIVTGDLRAITEVADTGEGGPTFVYQVSDVDPSTGKLILDSGEKWDDTFGQSTDTYNPAVPNPRPSYFEHAFNGILNLLGIGDAYELAPGTVVGAEPALQRLNPVEPDYPSGNDTARGQHLYRPESKDIDLYRFEVTRPGIFTAETIAQRLPAGSLLDTSLVVFRETTDSLGKVVRERVGRNDDYFGSDSFLELELKPGTYFVGISASGNEAYDPNVLDSGIGGTSEGEYDLRLNFRPTDRESIRDIDPVSGGTKLDGDGDGVAGGDYNFWFRTAPLVGDASLSAGDPKTIFVNKFPRPGTINPAAPLGSLSNPYQNLSAALSAAAAGPDRRLGDVVRVLANAGADNDIRTTGDNIAFEIGRGGLGNNVLPDGETLDVPKGVALMVDSGVIFKMKAARIGVGSSDPSVDRSAAALQVLGTPFVVSAAGAPITQNDGSRLPGSVFFTSYDHEQLGRDGNPLTTTPDRGNWGGIEFQNDVDIDQRRELFETNGIFLNYVNHADMRYGGGTVRVDGTPRTIRPVQMSEARPTVSHNIITLSSDAALGADPNSFKESNFHDPASQFPGSTPAKQYAFTSDYQRIGPHIVANTLVDNSTNGLFIDIATTSLGTTVPMTVSGRWDDTSTVHVVSENLQVAGTAGGPILTEDAPPANVVRIDPDASSGSLTAGDTVRYRITYVDADGFESPASNATESEVVPASGSVRLSQLPVVPTDSLGNFIFQGRNLYRSTGPSGEGPFELVDTLDATQTTYRDRGESIGGLLRRDTPIVNQVTLTPLTGGALPAGTYRYRVVFVDSSGVEQPASVDTNSLSIPGDPTAQGGPGFGRIRLTNLPDVPAGSFARVYRATAGSSVYSLATTYTPGTTTATDSGGVFPGVAPLDPQLIGTLRTRPEARLSIDPNTVVKVTSARIEASFGGDLYAEGRDGRPVIFTSTLDDRYGRSGTFDTNGDDSLGDSERTPSPGDWSGIRFANLSDGSIDHALVTFGGGTSSVEGGFAGFNAVEIVQSDVRIAHSIFEENAAGIGGLFGVSPSGQLSTRLGRGFNSEAVIFVRGAQPTIIENIIRSNDGAAISINPNALSSDSVIDPGRAAGPIDRMPGMAENQGPLVRGNMMRGNVINGMEVRGETLTTQSVWDDTDITHIVRSEIVVPDFHHFGGLRLESRANESLVVKLDGNNAGFTATGRPLDIVDRIGGAVHIMGQPGFPVILTSLFDSSVGAGFDDLGRPQLVSSNRSDSPRPGDWRSVRLEEFSHDRNVDVLVENEPAELRAPGNNAIPSVAQFLGGLAPRESASDENRRLGFEVHGTISEPGDFDVYTFVGTPGTEVWFDIDRTTHALDTVVELIDSNGTILAISDDSFTESLDPGTVLTPGGNPARQLPLNKSAHQGKDLYGTNTRDAGMRVVLPGTGTAERQYFVRVRASNLDNAAAVVDPTDLLDPVAAPYPGRSSGSYQLNVRLRELDEVPGSTVRYADIRFATNGIEILGGPKHSPFTGEAAETVNGAGVDSNGSIGSRVFVGNLGNTDRAALSINGVIGNSDASGVNGRDVDFYQFAINYDSIHDSIDPPDRRYLPIVVDVDYADGLGRANTGLAIYNSAGQLIALGTDSNIADDQGSPLRGIDMENLLAGSAGQTDAYIGPLELFEGDYSLAVHSIASMPGPLDQFTDIDSSNPNVRVIPADVARRLQEDTIEFTHSEYTADPAIESQPITSTNAQWHLDDMMLFLSRDVGVTGSNRSALLGVNPYTGSRRNLLGQWGEPVGDIAMRRDGELFGYSLGPQSGGINNGNTGNFQNVDPAGNTGDLVQSSPDDGLTASEENPTTGAIDVRGDDSALVQWTAMEFNRANPSAFGGVPNIPDGERFVAVGSKRTPGNGVTFNNNLVFSMVANSGAATNRGSTNGNLDRDVGNSITIFDGPATNKQELGIIDTSRGQGQIGTRTTVGGGPDVVVYPERTITGIAVDPDDNDIFYAVDDQGGLYRVHADQFQAPDAGSFNQGYDRVYVTEFLGGIDPVDPNATGFANVQGLTFGPRVVEGGKYRETLFAVTSNGVLYAIDRDNQPVEAFVNGRTKQQIDTTGGPISGLAFSTLQNNIWHETTDRFEDFGHGPFDTPNESRARAAATGVESLYFGREPTANVDDNRINYDAGNVGSLTPGGAHGSVISHSMDLSDYSPGDRPMLYFNYFLETEGTNYNPFQPNPTLMRDSIRVYASGDDGEWQLLVTNDSFRDSVNADEFDYFDDNGAVIEEAFDNRGWRQARADMSQLAGSENVRVQFVFSTHGGTDFNVLPEREELVAKPGAKLRDGQRMTIGVDNGFFSSVSQTFEIEIGQSLVMPSGAALADGETITLSLPNGSTQTYRFTNGGSVPGGQAPVFFTSGDTAAVVAQRFASALGNIAAAVQGAEVQFALPHIVDTPQNVTVNSGADPSFTFPAGNRINDGDTVVLRNGLGQEFTYEFDNDGQREVAGSRLIPFGRGTEQPTPNPVTPSSQIAADIQAAAQADGVVVQRAGSTLSVPRYRVVGNTTSAVELGGTGVSGFNHHPIYVDATMTDAEVATRIAEAFGREIGGDESDYKRFEERLEIHLNTVDDPGPFGFNGQLQGEEFGDFGSPRFAEGSGAIDNRGLTNNDVEGIYIDDMMIGFAERGELVLNAPTGGDSFIDDPRVLGPQPELVTEATTGGYQVEIRTGSEYGVPWEPLQLRPNLLLDTSGYGTQGGRSVDTNDRFANAVTLAAQDPSVYRDGDVFVLSDGTDLVTFEFDDLRLPNNPGVTSGHVQIVFDTVNDTPESMAAKIRDAINSPATQSTLDVRAQTTDSRETGPSGSARIDLFGDTVLVNPSVGRTFTVDMLANEQLTKADPFIPTTTDTFARAVKTPYENGNTDTLIATGRVGDRPFDDAGGTSLFNDADYLRIRLEAGQQIAIDVDTTSVTPASANGTTLFLSILNSAGVSLDSSFSGRAPGETAGEGYLEFTAPSTGDFLIGLQRFGGIVDYVMTVRPANLVSNGVAITRDMVGADVHQDHGDQNRFRDQGQIVIRSAFVSDSLSNGILVDSGRRALAGDGTAANLPKPGPVRLLRNENADRLTVGPVLVNNLLINNGSTGIRFQGDAVTSGQMDNAAYYGRIVNNTIVGDGTTTGIFLGAGTSPVVVNNVVANNATGIRRNTDNNDRPAALANNLYKDNNNAVSTGVLGDRDINLDADPQLNQTLFVDAASRIFLPASGSLAIDSSRNQLNDYLEFVNTVKTPMGIGASNVLAPEGDAFGQARVDDPAVPNSEGGQGSNPFKDRGALERADFAQPTAELVIPRDNDAQGIDTDPNESFIRLASGVFDSFEIVLQDGDGTGPDPRTVTARGVTLTENGRLLTEGTDYSFGFNPTNRSIRLTPLSGIWRPDAVYEINLNNRDRFIISAAAGDDLNDGAQFTFSETAGARPTYEFDSGYAIQVPLTTVVEIPAAGFGPGGVQEGDRLEVSFAGAQGTSNAVFEFDTDGNLVDTAATRVSVSPGATPQQLRDALLAAIQTHLATDSSLNLDPSAVAGSNRQIRLGTRPGHSVNTANSALVELGQEEGIEVGATLALYEAGNPDDAQVFEFVLPGGQSSGGNIPIEFSYGDSQDEIADKIVAAITGNAPAGIDAPVNLGDGIVLLGGELDASGDPLQTVEVTSDQLQLIGTPGVTGKLRISFADVVSDGVQDGQTFSITRAGVTTVFEFDSDNSLNAGSARRVVIGQGDTGEQVANAVRSVISAASLGLNPQVADGVLTLDETAEYRFDFSSTVVQTEGVTGGAIRIPFTPSADFTANETAVVLKNVINQVGASLGLTARAQVRSGQTLFITGVDSINGIANESVAGVTDFADNPLAANRVNSETIFTIEMPDTGRDYGDASGSYPTVLAQDGARHVIVADSAILGSTITAEDDATPSPDASTDSGDDGVDFTSTIFNPFFPNPTAPAGEVVITATGTGLIDAWIDWNQDGDFLDLDEQVLTGVLVDSGANAISIPFPTSGVALAGETTARFRISPSGGTAPSGLAIGGEVEDYIVEVIAGQPPVALDASFTVDEENDLSASAPGLLVNTTDPDGDAFEVHPDDLGTRVLTYVDGTGATVSAGQVTILASGEFLYEPPQDFSTEPGSPITFTFRAIDSRGLPSVDPATVSITVNPVNDQPVATDDTLGDIYSFLGIPGLVGILEDETFTFSVDALLANDSTGAADENDLLEVVRSSLAPISVGTAGVTLGSTVSLSSDGSEISIAGAANASGVAGFTYQIDDNSGAANSVSNTATVTFTVLPVNDAPVADPTPAEFTTPENTTLSGINLNTILGDNFPADPNATPPASDELTGPNAQGLAIVDVDATTAGNGTVTFNPATGEVTYTPAQGFFTVGAQRDFITYTFRDTSSTGGSPVSHQRLPGDQSVEQLADGSLEQTGTIAVSVTPINDPPTIDPVQFAALEDFGASVNDFLDTFNATGGPGETQDLLNVTTLNGGTSQGGSFQFQLDAGGDYDLTYTPPSGSFFGEDTFVFTITDTPPASQGFGPGDEESITVTATVTVRPVNDPPTAPTATVEGLEDRTLTITAAQLLAGAAVNGPGVQAETSSIAGNVPQTLVLDEGDPNNPAVQLVSGPAGASIQPLPGGGYGLTLPENYFNRDEAGNVLPGAVPLVLSYRVNDQGQSFFVQGGSVSSTSQPDPLTATGTVNVSIFPVNDPPVTGTHTRTVSEDPAAPLVIDASTLFSATPAPQDTAGPGETSQSVRLTVAPGTTLPTSAGGTILANDTNGDGVTDQFLYTPPANFASASPNGPDTFEYEVLDDGQSFELNAGAVTGPVADPLTATGTLAINVTPVNDPPVFFLASSPVLQEDNGQTDGGAHLVTIPNFVVGVRPGPSSAVDEAGQPVTFSVTGGGSLLTTGPSGQPPISLAGAPDSPVRDLQLWLAPNAEGTATITVTGTDGAGGNESTVQTFTLTVNAVNDPPEFTVQSPQITIDEDAGLQTIPNWASDILPGPATALDEVGQEVSFTVIPQSGADLFTLLPSVDEDGQLQFAAAPDASGEAIFEVRASDRGLDNPPNRRTSDPVLLTITINPVNDAPEAQNDSYATGEDTPLVIAAPGVLDNDSDADGDPLQVVSHDVVSASGAAVTVNADGSFTYDATDAPEVQALADGEILNDTFTYTISDGTGTGTTEAIVTVMVTGANDAPTGQSVTVNAGTNRTTVIPVLDFVDDIDSQLDPASVIVVSPPSAGNVQVRTDGTVLYTPNTGFTGIDSFSVRVRDTDGDSSSTFTITLNVNEPPVAQPDEAATVRTDPVDIDVLSNDTDPDGQIDPSTLTITSQPQHGTASIVIVNGAVLIRYTAGPDFPPASQPNNVQDQDEFTYTVRDAAGTLSNTAVVRVDVLKSLARNPDENTDVDGDGFTSPRDALLVINLLNRTGEASLDLDDPELYDPDNGELKHFYDVDGNEQVQSLDALRVINMLNRQATPQFGEGEALLPGDEAGRKPIAERQQVEHVGLVDLDSDDAASAFDAVASASALDLVLEDLVSDRDQEAEDGHESIDEIWTRLGELQ